MIGNYIIKNAHEYKINKVIALPNDRIESCSNDKAIKIWRSNPPYSDIPIRVLEERIENITSLLYIKERDIMISAYFNNTLSRCNMSTYQFEIEGVRCCLNSLYQIDKDRVIVGG